MTRRKEQTEKSSLRSYLILGAIALAAVVIIAALRGLFEAQSAQEAMGILSDSCLIPGIVLMGAGGLGFAASKGAYDSFGYLFSRFSLHSLMPTRQTGKRVESFYEYKRQKDEQGRAWSPVVLVTGAGCMAISGVFLALYALL